MTNYGKVKKPLRDQLLDLLSDLQWHAFSELEAAGGLRYGARLLELKRLGYDVATQGMGGDNTGNWYRLTSTTPGRAQPKRVKVLLEEQDVESLLNGGGLSSAASQALTKALGSYRHNKYKL